MLLWGSREQNSVAGNVERSVSCEVPLAISSGSLKSGLYSTFFWAVDYYTSLTHGALSHEEQDTVKC